MDINFDKLLEKFCEEENICPTHEEKIILKLAMIYGGKKVLELLK